MIADQLSRTVKFNENYIYHTVHSGIIVIKHHHKQ